jgi:hypothetical protein
MLGRVTVRSIERGQATKAAEGVSVGGFVVFRKRAS